MRCCGFMLAAPSLGLVPDVATVGEALGGGVSSVAAVLFDTRAFGKPAFPSMSTTTNDNLSGHVALGVLAQVGLRVGGAVAVVGVVVWWWRWRCGGGGGGCCSRGREVRMQEGQGRGVGGLA